MSETNLENPAGRVFMLLSHCLELSAGTQSILYGWSTYFGLNGEYSPQFAEYAAEMYRQPALARQAIQDLDHSPISPEILAKPLDDAETILAMVQSPRDPMHSMQERIRNTGVLYGLSVCSDVLSKTHHARAHVDKPVLQEALALVNALVQLVRQNEALSAGAKETLLNHCSRLQHAIWMVDIRGSEPVVNERDQLVGHLVLNPNQSAEIAKQPEIRSKLRSLVAAVSSIVILTGAPVAISANVQTVIEMLSVDTHSSIEAPSDDTGDQAIVIETNAQP
ncbi:hypothetical protein ACUWEX_13795 [Okibacterium fritillariae]|uniref:hypothetical protein n=1 Tax=Okibacterium fritillariae TaxID=123320 RepID=UPI0040554072